MELFIPDVILERVSGVGLVTKAYVEFGDELNVRATTATPTTATKVAHRVTAVSGIRR